MEAQSESAIIKALSFIKDGSPDLAKKELERAFPADIENNRLRVFISYCNVWIGAYGEIESYTGLERGDFLLIKWNRFEEWTGQSSAGFDSYELYESVMFAFKVCVYTRALNEFSQVQSDGDQKFQAEILRKTGLCEKRLGNYDKALELLREANSQNPGQADILAEMADCLDLCGDSKLAKILYREAFFVDPEKVAIENLDSPLIHDLVSWISETKGYSGSELREWLPVYGILLGALNVKRPLKSQEVAHLKQSIYSKENELRGAEKRELLVPRLMNLYLWLMDHYLLSRESTIKINELLLKIKLLDAEIFEEYFK